MEYYKLSTGEKIQVNEDKICYMVSGSDDYYTLHMKNGDILYAKTTTPPLPEEYTELEFIQTAGKGEDDGQYLNTSFKSGENLIFKLTMEMSDGATGTSICDTAKTMFTTQGYGGGGGEKVPGRIYVMYHEEEGKKHEEGSFENPIIIDDETGSYSKHQYVIDYPGKKVYCDDRSWSMNTPVTAYADEYPFTIGGWYENGIIYYRSTGKWYGFEVIQVDETTGEKTQLIYLQPAIRKSDNEPGMYDFTKKVFITNSGTGTLGYKYTEDEGGLYVPPTNPSL